MKSLFVTISFLVISSLSFSQIGVGTFISHSDVLNNVGFSLQTSPLKKYGLTTRFGIGLPITSYTSSLNVNTILTRRFYQSENVNMYTGIGVLYEFRTFQSSILVDPIPRYNYHNWGLNVPVGIEVFPGRKNRDFSIFLESSLVYMNTHQNYYSVPTFNSTPESNRYFGLTGTIGLKYYFGRKK